MQLIPGFPLSPRGRRRGHLFSFYLLYCTRAAWLPRIACSKQADFFFLLNTQFSFCFDFVASLFQSFAGTRWWPARGYRAGCAPALISILSQERIILGGNTQKQQSVVWFLHPGCCKFPESAGKFTPKIPCPTPISCPAVFMRRVMAVAFLLLIWGIYGRSPVCGVGCVRSAGREVEAIVPLGPHFSTSRWTGCSPLLMGD